MSSNGVTSSAVASNEGTMVQVNDLNVPSSRIYSFVTRYRKAYFEDHSLEWCLDEILNRGMAEITRQVKTAEKAAKNRAAGTLMDELHMTPAQAAEVIRKWQAEQAAATKAKA